MGGIFVSVQVRAVRKQGETLPGSAGRACGARESIPKGTAPATELLGTTVPQGNRIHGSQPFGLLPCSEGVGGTAYCNPGFV